MTFQITQIGRSLTLLNFSSPMQRHSGSATGNIPIQTSLLVFFFERDSHLFLASFVKNPKSCYRQRRVAFASAHSRCQTQGLNAAKASFPKFLLSRWRRSALSGPHDLRRSLKPLLKTYSIVGLRLLLVRFCQALASRSLPQSKNVAQVLAKPFSLPSIVWSTRPAPS